MPTAPETTTRYCLSCGYSLAHLDASRCPECGRMFDPENPATFADAPLPRWRRCAPWIAGVPIVLLLFYAGGLTLLYLDWRQEQPIVEMVTANGSVLYKRIGPKWMGRVVPWFAREWLQRVEMARMQSDGFTDESIEMLAELRELRDLRLMNTIISSSALEHLTRSPKLEFLTLTENAVDGKALRAVQDLPRLKQLILVNPNLNDQEIGAFQAARPDVSVQLSN